MKRLALPLLAAFLALAGQAKAQDLSFGVRGGLNLAGSSTEGSLFTEDVGRQTGYHFGILGNVEISTYFSVQTELWYSRKGFSEGDGDVALKVTYFEIPVLAVLKIPARISPHLYLGPVLGLESGCRVTFQDEERDCENAPQGAPTTKGADSGILFGGGVTWDAGPGLLIFDAMYNMGLTNISETSETIDSVETRTFYLSAAFALSLGTPGR